MLVIQKKKKINNQNLINKKQLKRKQTKLLIIKCNNQSSSSSSSFNNNNIHKCTKCGELIMDKHLAQISPERFLHEYCACCSICNCPLLLNNNSLIFNNNNNLISPQKCFEREGRLFCAMHYINEFCSNLTTFCVGCNNPIKSNDFVYKLKSGIIFHINCHRCFNCGRLLSPGEQIIINEQNKTISCASHFLNEENNNLNNNINSSSPQIINNFIENPINNILLNEKTKNEENGTELAEQILRQNVFKMALEEIKGNNNNPSTNSLENNFEQNLTKLNEKVLLINNTTILQNNILENNNKKNKSSDNLRKKEKQKKLPKQNLNIPNIPQYPFEMYAAGEQFSRQEEEFQQLIQGSKRRGPRTTISQEQLDMLNKIFETTPKPSKHARAILAIDSGLSMRVIQVWFQNRRSKERRLKHLCNYLRHCDDDDDIIINKTNRTSKTIKIIK